MAYKLEDALKLHEKGLSDNTSTLLTLHEFFKHVIHWKEVIYQSKEFMALLDIPF